MKHPYPYLRKNYIFLVHSNLSVVEMRVLQMILLEFRKGLSTSKEVKPITIKASLYAELFNTTLQNSYRRMKEVREPLLSREFIYEENGEEVKGKWISSFRYLDEKGAIEVEVSDEVRRAFIEIGSRLGSVSYQHVKNTTKMSSQYSMRLYAILYDYQRFPRVVLTLKELKAFMGVKENQYPILYDFKKRCLDLAVSEINKLSDIYVQYTQLKEGRKIIGLRFEVCKNYSNQDNDDHLLSLNH